MPVTFLSETHRLEGRSWFYRQWWIWRLADFHEKKIRNDTTKYDTIGIGIWYRFTIGDRNKNKDHADANLEDN